MMGITLPPTPVPTPTPPYTFQELSALMLGLTNEERAKAGVAPVRLGDNPAAQLHADAALDGCYSSHWDRWGLKPNHRYSLAGGTGAESENVYGMAFCVSPRSGYAAIRIRGKVAEAVSEWMGSPGHRRALLNSAHTVLNVGIAYGRYNTVMVQQFESDYVEYRTKPAISPEGRLNMAGTVNGATLEIGEFSSVQIAYDPPPKALTRGQLAHTYGLCNPQEIAIVLKPAPAGTHYDDLDGFTKNVTVQCVDPYETSPDRPAPASPGQANWIWESAMLNPPVFRQVEVEYVIADTLYVTANTFDVSVDLMQLLERHGPGIYTVRLWGLPNHMKGRGSPVVLSEQAIFWKTAPPEGNPYSSGVKRLGYRSDR